ncbi:MAG: transposase family protein [Pirellulaceae bacterium]|nr:transposase family protein [Pirellulaceae bacterium]
MSTAKAVRVELVNQYFESLSDPRNTKNRKHKLTDLIVICICAIISGAKGPTGTRALGQGQARLSGKVLGASRWPAITRLYSQGAHRA